MCLQIHKDSIFEMPIYKTVSSKMGVRVRLRMLNLLRLDFLSSYDGYSLSHTFPNPVTLFHVTSLSRIRAPLVANPFRKFLPK
jgi:hypothetical protein